MALLNNRIFLQIKRSKRAFLAFYARNFMRNIWLNAGLFYYATTPLAIAFCRGFSALMAGTVIVLTNNIKNDIPFIINSLSDNFKGIHVEREVDLAHKNATI